MIVTCEKCGEKYQIDPAQIKGKTASFPCESCNNMITVTPPEGSPPKSPPPAKKATKDRGEKGPPPPEAEEKVPKGIGSIRNRLGLRAKMFILFFLVPIILILAASLLYIWQLNTLSSRLAKGSSEMVTHMSEDVIIKRAQAVATQTQLYLTTHPELKKNLFMYDSGFRAVALQKVGLEDYTALYEKPGKDGIWRTWVHVNPDIVGIDMSTLKESLGEHFDGFWDIFTGVKAKDISQGDYKWRDRDGAVRPKFMACVPVAGTPYFIAATTYTEEFTDPIQLMQESADRFAVRTRTIIIGILVATLILVGFIVFTYSYRLAGKMKYLTDVTDRISVGDLDAEIVGIQSNDEIGELANAMKRMQASVRLAVKRLRERR
jgi:HAMP domain-containing protein